MSKGNTEKSKEGRGKAGRRGKGRKGRKRIKTPKGSYLDRMMRAKG